MNTNASPHDQGSRTKDQLKYFNGLVSIAKDT